jgi:hypothetical protein
MLNNPSNLHQALMPPDVPGHFWDLGVHPESLQHPDSRTASKSSRYHRHVVHTRPYYWTRHGLRDLSRLAPPGPSIPGDREPSTKSSVPLPLLLPSRPCSGSRRSTGRTPRSTVSSPGWNTLLSTEEQSLPPTGGCGANKASIGATFVLTKYTIPTS